MEATWVLDHTVCSQRIIPDVSLRCVALVWLYMPSRMSRSSMLWYGMVSSMHSSRGVYERIMSSGTKYNGFHAHAFHIVCCSE